MTDKLNQSFCVLSPLFFILNLLPSTFRFWIKALAGVWYKNVRDVYCFLKGVRGGEKSVEVGLAQNLVYLNEREQATNYLRTSNYFLQKSRILPEKSPPKKQNFTKHDHFLRIEFFSMNFLRGWLPSLCNNKEEEKGYDYYKPESTFSSILILFPFFLLLFLCIPFSSSQFLFI